MICTHGPVKKHGAFEMGLHVSDAGKRLWLNGCLHGVLGGTLLYFAHGGKFALCDAETVRDGDDAESGLGETGATGPDGAEGVRGEGGGFGGVEQLCGTDKSDGAFLDKVC